MSAHFTWKWSSFSGEIRAHPKINFVMGYIYVCSKDSGHPIHMNEMQFTKYFIKPQHFWQKSSRFEYLIPIYWLFQKGSIPRETNDRGIFKAPSPKIGIVKTSSPKILGYVYVNYEDGKNENSPENSLCKNWLKFVYRYRWLDGRSLREQRLAEAGFPHCKYSLS